MDQRCVYDIDRYNSVVIAVGVQNTIRFKTPFGRRTNRLEKKSAEMEKAAILKRSFEKRRYFSSLRFSLFI